MTFFLGLGGFKKYEKQTRGGWGSKNVYVTRHFLLSKSIEVGHFRKVQNLVDLIYEGPIRVDGHKYL